MHSREIKPRSPRGPIANSPTKLRVVRFAGSFQSCRDVPFHLHTSNRLDRLATQLADVMRVPLASPFTAETVIVQSLGMARWLKLELARRLGVCAQVAFPFPRAFADGLFGRTLPSAPEGEPFSRGVMQWRLFRLLSTLPDAEAFIAPRSYLADADPRKRLQLAARLANLFDQYLIFRPDFIARWEAGNMLPEEAWQAELWRCVAREISAPHPARLHADFLAALTQPPPNELPERLALFGVSALPPFYLDLFAALARHTEVHCFLLQPCAEWWGDVSSGREAERTLRRLRRPAGDAAEVHLESGHRLLGSLGTLGRDFLKLIYEHTDPVEHADFVAPTDDSLLHRLQRDLQDLNDSDSGVKLPVASDDDSIRLHVCHSPVRELEVLHDHLLDWFQRDSTLTPRDVLVMTPDIETYAPLVQAVFDAPESAEQRIPYSLADRGLRQSGQIAGTFLGLLRLAGGRLGVTAVLDLLECAALRGRFGLVESDLPTLRHWITDTRIHWGRDAAHRMALGQPGTAANTWRAGLRRLLLGYAMGGDETELFASIVPYPEIEGGPAELLGRMADFAERLFAAVESLEQRRAAEEWMPLLLGLLDDFFAAEGEAGDELAQIRVALNQLHRQLVAAAVTEPIKLDVLFDVIAATLADDTSGAAFLTGGVTFCALKPMRSIPFRVICLIGMNDGAFPRQAPHLSFDLMAARPRLGDRSTRDDDRYLFLEALVSARDRLYLSHVGQSQRDNRPIPPSVVIGELLDHLDAAFTPENETGKLSESGLVVRHRVHAFSPAYFTADSASPLFSYSHENCASAGSARARRTELYPFCVGQLSGPAPELRRVSLRQLAEFLSHPAKFMLRERLGMELPGGLEISNDAEPLSLDARAAYDLKQDLIAWELAGKPADSFADLFATQGRLPSGPPGVLAFHELREAAERFRARLGDTAAGGPVSVGLALGEFRLTGRLLPRRTGGLLHYRCTKLKAADRLRLWVEHLAWNLASTPESGPRISELVGEDMTLRFLPVAAAERHLRDLLELYWRGLQLPLRFFPRTALAFVEAEQRQIGGKSRAKTPPLEQARPEWLGNERLQLPGESADAWFRLCFRHEGDPLNDEFQTLARTVFGPLLAHSHREDA